MTNLKSPFLDAIVKTILILLSMKKKIKNRFTKDEIEAEISNLTKLLTDQADFQTFLLELLLSEERIRADERLNISLEKNARPKTGPLGNKIPKGKLNESDE